MSENIISVCRYVGMSVCRYVGMSVCQNATFQLRYQNESCSECHQDVRPSLCQYQYVYMLVCQYVRMQLYSLGIKMKVVQNVISMSDRQYVSKSKSQYVNMSVCQ